MAEQIFEEFGPAFEIRLVPSSGGVFEVEREGEVLFSKRDLGRHADYEDDIAPRLRG